MTAAIAIGLLVAGGVHLVLQRGLLRVVVGFVLLGHAVNLLVLTAGGTDRRGFPLPGRDGDTPAADPLPQAFVLTAIVIAFAVTVYLLGLLRAGSTGGTEGGTVPSPVDDAEGPR